MKANIIHNGIVLPPTSGTCSPKGGICTEDGKYIANSCPNYGAGGVYTPDNIDYSEETVIYIGWLNQVWGHTITDVLKKIWYVNTEECKQLIAQGAKLVYITHYEGEQKHVNDILSLAGIDTNKLQKVNKPIKFKAIYDPEDCFVSYGEKPHFSEEYICTIETIKSNVLIDFPIYEKIYFSRTLGTPRFSWKTLWVPKDLGEEKIEKLFKDEGYTIIHPEKYSVEQQIWMLSHCKAFAATEGSISHNAIFCSKGTNVAILKKEKIINRYTELINNASKVNVTIIDAHASYNVNSTYYGPFYLCITNKLERYFGHTIPHNPFWMEPLWYWYMIHNTIIGKGIQKLLRKL